jgi:hypothetical protein
LQRLSLPPTCLKNPNTTHTPRVAYHHDERGRGDMPCRRLWGGYIKAAPATLPLHYDWTGVR